MAPWGIAFVTLLSSCDGRLSIAPSHMKYSTCLADAVAGSSNRPLQELRSACGEVANVVDAHYKMENGEMVPSNDFTRCYDAEKKRLDSQGLKESIRFAKLSCRYPDVK
jgi:hypothetical protein